MFHKFLNSLKTPENASLVEAIQKGYNTIFEAGKARHVYESIKKGPQICMENTLNVTRITENLGKTLNEIYVNDIEIGYEIRVHPHRYVIIGFDDMNQAKIIKWTNDPNYPTDYAKTRFMTVQTFSVNKIPLRD